MANDFDFDDPMYGQAAREALIDNRVGNHDFMITQVEEGTWPSGDSFMKYRGVLLTADNAKTELTLNDPLTPEQMREEYPKMEAKAKKAVGHNITKLIALKQNYGITNLDQLTVNTVLRVKTEKDRNGFIRVMVILPKTESTNQAASNAADVPF